MVTTALAIQAGRLIGEFLIDEYGDDALRALARFLERRRGNAADLEAADVLARGVGELLTALGRPFDEFFGPRIGDKLPSLPSPPSPPAPPFGPGGRYLVPLTKYPDRNEYAAGDEVWQKGEEATWVVTQKGVGVGRPAAPWRVVETFV